MKENKNLKHIKNFNEVTENLNISDIMKRSLEYYRYIDVMGEKLAKIISEKIEPLLQEGKYEDAKQMVRDFYKESRYKSSDDIEGDVIFIEYDMILANINQRNKKFYTGNIPKIESYLALDINTKNILDEDKDLRSMVKRLNEKGISNEDFIISYNFKNNSIERKL